MLGGGAVILRPELGAAKQLDNFATTQRSLLTKELNNYASKLPLGLLARLVSDAKMFHSHNLGKKSQRLIKRIPK